MLHPLSLIYCQLWGNRLSARQRIGLRSFKSPTSEGTITVTQKGCVCTSRPPRLKPGWPSASSFSSSRISPAARSSIRSSPVSPPASSPTCLLFHQQQHQNLQMAVWLHWAAHMVCLPYQTCMTACLTVPILPGHQPSFCQVRSSKRVVLRMGSCYTVEWLSGSQTWRGP